MVELSWSEFALAKRNFIVYLVNILKKYINIKNNLFLLRKPLTIRLITNGRILNQIKSKKKLNNKKKIQKTETLLSLKLK